MALSGLDRRAAKLEDSMERIPINSELLVPILNFVYNFNTCVLILSWYASLIHRFPRIFQFF
jgi:hypothetical protein